MKTISAIFLFFYSTTLMTAECLSYVLFYPESKYVSPNTNIIIEGNGISSGYDLIKYLDVKYPIFLKSKNHRIKLKRTSLFEGQDKIIHAVFSHDHLLRIGETYRLEIQNLPADEKSYFRSTNRIKSNGLRGTIEWTAKKELDKLKPEIIKPIEFCDAWFEFAACGNQIHNRFAFEAYDSSEIWIFAEVLELESKNKVRFYIKPEKGEFLVGRNMCTGAFKYKSKKSYKMRFKILDSNGNSGEWSSWIETDNPMDLKNVKKDDDNRVDGREQ